MVTKDTAREKAREKKAREATKGGKAREKAREATKGTVREVATKNFLHCGC